MTAPLDYVASRLSTVKSSASMGAAALAAEMRAAGVDVLSLAIGEPDFPTPLHASEAGIAAIRAGDTKYSAVGGTVSLKNAVIDKFRRDNGLIFDSNEVLISSGAKSIIFLAFMATLDAGDEVIVPAPHWVSYTDMTRLAGGTPVVVPCPADRQYKLDAASLEAALTPRTKWLTLNGPNNPTGATYSQAELESLADVLRRHPQVLVMVDEIYEHIRFDGRDFHSFAAVAPDLRNRTLTINGVSKAYAMTGWRVGFAGGPARLIAAMKLVQGQSLGSVSGISQAAAVAALQGPQGFLAERSAAFEERRNRVVSLLGAVPGLEVSRPEGAFYLFVGCAGLLGKTTPDGSTLQSDSDVTGFLLQQAQVMVVHGGAYGMSPFFRLSIAASMERLEEGCRRIARAVAELR